MADEKRPSELAKDGELEVFHDIVRAGAYLGGFEVPEGHGEDLTSFIKWCVGLPECKNSELRVIRDQMEGGSKAISAKYFPKPEGTDPKLWNQNKKLITHVNLVQPQVRTWVNAVYSDEAYRQVLEAPDQADLAEWLESDAFARDMYQWAVNKVAFGPSVAVPRYDEELEELYAWLLDPVYTHIKRDPVEPRKVIGVAERTHDRIEFICLWGEGVLLRDQDAVIVEFTEPLDWCPAVIGSPDTIPMVRDAVAASFAATMVLYNVRLMQKQQCKSILVRSDEIEKLKAIGAGGVKKTGDSSHIDVTEKGDAKYITPDPKIKESLDILSKQVCMLATASGTPADVLDPTLTESASSAEGSRIRAIPLIQHSKPLMRQWRTDEREFAIAGQYVLRRMAPGAKGAPIPYRKLRKQVKVDIGLSAAAIPMSPNEETQDLIAQISFGLMMPEDGVRKKNYAKPRDVITIMAEEIRTRMEQMGAQAAAQQATGGGRPPQLTGSGGSV